MMMRLPQVSSKTAVFHVCRRLGRLVGRLGYSPAVQLRTTAYLFATIGLVAVSACAGGDATTVPTAATLATAVVSPEPSAPANTVPTVTPVQTEARSEFADLANQMVIGSDGLYFVNIVDFRAALEAFGFRPPSTCDSDETLEQYGEDFASLVRLPLSPGPLLAADIGLDTRATYEEFGIRLCEITMTADEVSQELGRVLIMRVESDPADIERAVRADPIWSDLLTESEVNGGVLYDWGPEIFLERRTRLRPLRTGGKLFVREDIVVRSDEAAPIDAYFDGVGRRLGDQEYANDVFASLEHRGAVQIALTNRTYTIDANPGFDPAAVDSFQNALLPWEVLGLGLASNVQNEPVALLTLAHNSEGAAQENLRRLSRTLEEGSSFSQLAPWSELFEVTNLEVDGVMLHATLAGDRATPELYVSFIGGDNLFAVEDES